MTVKTRAQLKSENAADFPDNITQLISAADLRGQMDDVVDSMLMDEDNITGEQGPPGPQGPPGQGLDIKGSVATVAALPASGNASGDVYVVQEFDPDHLFMWDGTQWVDLGEGGGGSFIQKPGTSPPAIMRSVQDRLRDTIHLLDFIPVVEHDLIYNGDSTYDCSDAMDAAIGIVDVILTNAQFSGGPEIILPLGKLRFGRSIQIWKGLTLRGKGASTGNAGSATILEFDSYVSGTESGHGIIIYEGDGRYGGTGTPLKGVGTPRLMDFELRSKGVGEAATIGHGIWARGRFIAERLYIQTFPQNGLHINADSGASGVSKGNANNSYVQRVRCAGNGGSGIYVNGGDANACVFVHVDCTNNRLHGIWDSSFLGNTWIGPHCRDNGAAGLCSHNGAVYFITSPDKAATANTVEPGVTPGWQNTWTPILASNTHPLYQPWSPVTPFEFTRSFWGDSDSVTGGVVISPYTEGGVPPVSIVAPWLILDSIGGGVHEPGDNGAYIAGNFITPFDIQIKSSTPTPLIDSFKSGDDRFIQFTAGLGLGLNLAWDDLYKTFNQRFGAIAPGMRITSDVSTSIMGGRQTPIPAGRSIFTQGFWIGNASTTPATALAEARQMVNGTAAPTSGEWAQGDIVWNRAASNFGPAGWVCTTSGNITTSAWAADTSYAAGTVRRNPNVNGANVYRVVAGISAASGGPTGTGTAIVDGSVAWASQTLKAWKPLDSITEQDLPIPLYNGGPKKTGNIDGAVYWIYKAGGGGTIPWAANTYYLLNSIVTNAGKTYTNVRPGYSAASVGPTDTGDITDGSAVWRAIPPRLSTMPYILGEYCESDAAIWKCTVAGTSGGVAGAPTKPGPTVVDGTVTWTLQSSTTWLPNTGYAVDALIYNSDRPYICLTAGTSEIANFYIPRTIEDTAGNQGTGPLGIPELTDGSVKWINEWRKKTTQIWVASHVYAVGDLVYRNGYTYVCTQAGTSGLAATAPAGAGIYDAGVVWNYIQPWRANTRYEAGDFVTNDSGKLYKAVAGISAGSGGPAGTGTGIIDGSLVWDFVPPFVFSAFGGARLETQQTLTDITAGFTLLPLSSPYHTLVAGTFPATNVTCTLSTASDYPGLAFRITRTAVGAGGLVIGSSLTTLSEGEWCIVVSDGASWYLEARGRLQPDTRHTIITSPATTITVAPFSTGQRIKVDGALTANRNVTLSPTAAFAGLTYRITRTATDTGGPWMLNVGTGPLKAMAQNTWAEFTYDGTAWYLAAAGSVA